MTKTKIPVFQGYPLAHPITVQFGYTEDGEFIVEHCTHAGARYTKTIETISYLSFDGNHEKDVEYEGYVCDKCLAWSDDEENWDV